jgi:hypothetical protein
LGLPQVTCSLFTYTHMSNLSTLALSLKCARPLHLPQAQPPRQRVQPSYTSPRPQHTTGVTSTLLVAPWISLCARESALLTPPYLRLPPPTWPRCGAALWSRSISRRRRSHPQFRSRAREGGCGEPQSDGLRRRRRGHPTCVPAPVYPTTEHACLFLNMLLFVLALS